MKTSPAGSAQLAKSPQTRVISAQLAKSPQTRVIRSGAAREDDGMDDKHEAMSVFLLEHVRVSADGGEGDVKLLGVYSTQELAEARIERAKGLPGFRDYPDGFCVVECQLDNDEWCEGFGLLEEE
jgi:homoserine kinase type II